MAVSQKLLNDGETVVISTRTHPKALLAPLFWLALFVLVTRWFTRRPARTVWLPVVAIVWFVPDRRIEQRIGK